MLRPYQEQMKSEIYNHWDSGIKNVLLVLPTGMGKTRTFCAIAVEKAKQGLHVAISVHRKELVQQISLTLAEQGIVHNIIAPRPVILGIIGAQRQLLKKQFYDYNGMISVISVDTLNARILDHKEWAKKVKVWITDEAAHLLKENKWGRAVAYFNNAIGLGVTATPERLDKRGLGRHADGVFDTMVEGPNSRWGIDKGYLSSYRIVVPKSDYREFLKETKGDSDFSKEAMTFASEKSRIVGDIVENYQKFAAGKQAIVFASDIGSAFRIEKKFKEVGITAKTLTGDTADKERFDAMVDYREKKTKVLINVDLFDEGLDVPGIEAVIMGRPTKSLGKYLQMVGRGLRTAKGKPYLILIDHVGNVKDHGLPDSIRRWTLDRIIRRRKKINLIRFCQNVTCNSPYDRLLSECPYCGNADTSGTSRSGGGGRVGPTQVDGDLVMLDPDTYRELEANTRLEDPAKLAERVSKVAGGAAGLSAMEKQRERIQTQKELAQVVAEWAGAQRQRYGLTDRMIHKKYYMLYEKTIWESLGEPRAEMLETINELKGDFWA